MEAVILAGGKGTRLRSVINYIPKPMAPIEEKPFLEYLLKFLEKNGITRVVISVGYKWEYIQKYFANRYNNIELVYSIDNEFYETGGALKNALSKVISDEVYIIHGDTYFDIDLSHMVLTKDSMICLSLKHMIKFNRYGCVEQDKRGYVKRFTEKKYQEEGYINGGIYLLKTNIFNNFNVNKKFSFEKFMEKNLKSLKITTHIFNNYFIDIGIPKDYEKAKLDKYISSRF